MVQPSQQQVMSKLQAQRSVSVLQPAAIVCTLFFTAIAFAHHWAMPKPQAIIMSVIAGASAVTAAIIWRLTTSDVRLSNRVVAVLLGVLLSTGIINPLAHLLVTSDILQSTNVFIMYFACAFIIASTRWFVYLTLATSIAWVGCLLLLPFDGQQTIHFGFANTISLAFSYGVFFSRLQLLRSTATEVIHRQQAEQKLKRANEQLQQLALFDPLTGIANRRHLDEYLQQQWTLAQQSNQPVAMLVCDLDHFKTLNDQYGHMVGDQVLVVVAGILSKQASNFGGFAARFGGEEFVIVLPGSDIAQSEQVAEQICNAVAQDTTVSVPVTTSIGISAVIPSPQSNADALMRAADRALYKAKEAGRNCFRVKQ